MCHSAAFRTRGVGGRQVARIGALGAQPPLQLADIDVVERRRRPSSASAAATPAASPIAMQGGISRDMRCADDVAE